jgi:alanine dehydrogenase
MPDMAAIPVAVSGFSWGAAGIWTLVAGGVAAYIKTRPRSQEIASKTEADLRSDLIKRVESLELKLAQKDAQHEEDVALREQEIAIMRHRANNSDACIDALLLLLEQSPEKVKEAVSMIKDMRSRQREAEAIEKAAFHQTKVARAATKTGAI